MIKIQIIALFLLIVATPLISQQISLDVEEVLTIGGENIDEDEYIFSHPLHIVTDLENNIYVADENLASIRVYDKMGKYIRSISRKGQGPGENQEITCMTIDNKNDDLIIVDRMNQRFTRFHNMGDTFKTFRFSDQSYIEPRYIHNFSINTFALYYNFRSTDGYSSNSYGKIIHIITDNFQSTSLSIAPANKIWDLSESFNHALVRMSALKISIIDSSLFFLAHKYYDGLLYMCKRTQNDWAVSSLHGKKPFQKPYIKHDCSDFKKNKQHYTNSIMYSGHAGRFCVSIKNRIIGLFKFGNNEVIQFVLMSTRRKKLIFGVNFFKTTGKFLGFSEIKTLNIQSQPIFRLEVLWRDNDGRFYISDTREYPMIRVLTIRKQQ